MKGILTTLTCLIGLCPAQPDVPPVDLDAPVTQQGQLNKLEAAAGMKAISQPYTNKTLSGNYLASQFAQRNHDWKRAEDYLQNVLTIAPQSTQLLSRSMILSMGSGQPEKAFEFAQKLIEQEPDNSLAGLLLATQSIKQKNYSQAVEIIEAMPEGGLSEFMTPLLLSWAKAGAGEHDTLELNGNTIHLYHAIMIADYLEQNSNIEVLLAQSLSAHGLTLEDVVRIADLYAHIGKKEIALELYDKTLQEWPDNKAIKDKVAALESGQNTPTFKPITSPEEGVGEAFYDMAKLLYREHSDESARVFVNMASYLSGMTRATLLKAHIASRNNQYDDAISYYQAVSSDDESFKESRRLAASLLEDEERDEEAMVELEKLFREHNDIDALIQIGDIYRRNDEYGKAILTYNQVEDAFGKAIPQDYWHLHYVRGMSYEQYGNWEKAEADLKAALSFQPNHPLVLNYLGYAWADQGINLKQSLELIRQAAEQEQNDGYIIDSLGWVLFRMGHYEEAVPHLERAVELLPYDPIINDHLGDAYWQVGRRLEARFQWERARNHSDDESLSIAISDKLENGLQLVEIVKEAHAENTEPDIIEQ